jgi:hypothetical protein
VQFSDPPNDASRFAPLRWVLCIAVFLVVDIFICPVMFGPEPDVAGKVVLGMFIAQAGLYASWVVLAPRPLRVRIAAASLLGLVWLVTMVWSCVSFNPYEFDYPQDVAVGCALVPLVAIGFLAPLWMVQGWFRWRILCPAPMMAEPRHEGFRIRDMFIGTTVVAIAFGAVEVASRAADSGDLVIGTSIMATVAAVISLLVVLPLLAATLRARRVWLVLPVTICLQFAVFLGTIAILHAVFEGGPGSSRAMWALGPVFAVLCVCLSVAMLVVRWCGYRLVWGPYRVGTMP